ncbi:3'-5' exonuclease [Thermus aquaticus]|uniref:DNA polymerase III epsilon subunit n=1 Tax=Thermus aquaticus (strain ATCC BAA-2747 / Y51MC23) TaxID=498848 RepID=A0ABM5VMB1_THEA5|nr:exonuclease domain-containing protein [Thermus aquaticus]ALJ91297.1 DNA polymerase III epsilon subunit [Thermus aquaticus Y51MC23]
MREVFRFLGALLLGLLLVGGVVGLALFLLLQDQEALAREFLELARAKAPLLLFVAFLFALVLGALLHPLFLGYLAATRALGQEAEILLANPSHRLPLKGPLELQALGRLVQRLAEEKAALEKEVEARVQEAKALVERERAILSALIAHLPQGVVLANPRGQVVLYNPKAQELLGEGLGIGKSLFGLLDPGLLAHALRLPKERFLTQARGKNLLLQAVPLSEGMGLILEAQKGEEGLDEATLHRLKDKLAGLKALAEILAQEAPPEVRPLAEKAQEAAQELAQLVQALKPSPQAAEVLAQDLLALLAETLEREAGVQPGLALEEETRWLLLRVDTYALGRGLAATLKEAEEVLLEGRALEGFLRLSLLFPHPAPDPHPLLKEAVEKAGGSLWREGNRLILLLPAVKAPSLPAPPGPPPRAEVFDLSLLQVSEALEEAPLEGLLYTAFDLETTGLDPREDAIIALGAVHLLGSRVLRHEVYEALVDPGRPIPKASTEVHGLTWEMLKDKPKLEEVLPAFRAFLEGSVLVAHNGAFDMAFLRKVGIDQPPLVDTLLLAHLLFPDLKDHRLERLAERFGVPVLGRHTALGDALMTAEVYARMIPLLKERGFRTLGQALRACERLPLARLKY